MAKLIRHPIRCGFCTEVASHKCDSCEFFLCEEHTKHNIPEKEFEDYDICPDCVKGDREVLWKNVCLQG